MKTNGTGVVYVCRPFFEVVAIIFNCLLSCIAKKVSSNTI